jgi:hypothetical protein
MFGRVLTRIKFSPSGFGSLCYVQTKDFLPFAWYRFILGALVIVVTMIR